MNTPSLITLLGTLLVPSLVSAQAAKPLDGTPVVACSTSPAHMGCVPGGAFLRGSNHGPANSHPRQSIWLQTFYMDKYEVTVEAYQACVKTGKCKTARTLYGDFSRPRQPKVGVTWFNAVQFCKATGKHLPTEAQWEKAARGVDGRMFPWGNGDCTCKRAVIKDHRGRSCGLKKRGGSPLKGRTLVVGSRPPTQFGLHDMAGNAWEWVHDWYSPSYKACGAGCQGTAPRGPCQGALSCRGHQQRVVRGGSWYWGCRRATTYYRRRHYPFNKFPNYHHFGFRCAASPKEAAELVAQEKVTGRP